MNIYDYKVLDAKDLKYLIFLVTSSDIRLLGRRRFRKGHQRFHQNN